MTRFTLCGCMAAAAGLAFVPDVLGQWTVNNLHPFGATWSEARGVDGQEVVGIVAVNSVPRPSLWNGSSSAYVDLNPPGIFGSDAFGIGGGQQVGNTDRNAISGQYRPRATIWSGTAASFVEINPSEATAGSVLLGVGGGQQVGYIRVGVINTPDVYAGLWSGTASSFVNLNPAGSRVSRALGVNNGQQVGLAIVGDVHRASLWTGSAASWVDLHPAGAQFSIAKGVAGGQQVGSTQLTPNGFDEASLWTGTSSSFVNLNPAGAGSSSAEAVAGGVQVGWAFFDDGTGMGTGQQRAGLWTGTAASWVDLHAFLPSSFESSQATGIWTDGTTTRISGWGINSAVAGGRAEALVWTIPAPSTAALGLAGFIAIRQRQSRSTARR